MGSQSATPCDREKMSGSFEVTLFAVAVHIKYMPRGEEKTVTA
jgi:hypothetical protein